MVSRLLLAAGMSRTSRVLVTCLLPLAAMIALALPSAAAQPAPVVGGSTVPPNKWNDVVAVIAEGASCTGTLIAPDVVLTAGHCIDLEPYEVVTNTTDFRRPGGDRIAVKWARAFPDWATRYDIGVLMLEHVARPVPRPIAAACHANQRLREAAPLTIVGFGLTTPDAFDDNTRLHEATIPVLDPLCEGDASCESSVRPNGEFTAGGRGTDSCFGDSGGPAFLDTPAGPALVGVVSRGLAIPGQPCGNGGVYVRADKIVAWAQSVTGRRFARTSCDGERVDDPGELPEDSGGCNATGVVGAGGPRPLTIGLGLVVAITVLRRRRRRAPLSPADSEAVLVSALVEPAPPAPASAAQVQPAPSAS